MDEIWRKSTKCESSACAETALRHGYVGVRNTKVPEEVAWFTPDEWRAFIEGAKAGEFDV